MIKTDLKQKYPKIITYVQEHNCTFSEAVQHYERQKHSKKGIQTPLSDFIVVKEG